MQDATEPSPAMGSNYVLDVSFFLEPYDDIITLVLTLENAVYGCDCKQSTESTYTISRVNAGYFDGTLKHVLDPGPYKVTPFVLTSRCQLIGIAGPWVPYDEPLGRNHHFEITIAYCVKLERNQSNSISVSRCTSGRSDFESTIQDLQI